MQSRATTVDYYLAALPEDRRRAVSAVRAVIRANLDSGYDEGMQYGMIGYYVPLSVHPAGCHGNPTQPVRFAGLASQKLYMALYLMGVCWGPGENAQDQAADAQWFREAWLRTGRKLDMGKSCVRFKTLEDVALDVVAESTRRIPATTYIARYRATLRGPANKAARSAAR